MKNTVKVYMARQPILDCEKNTYGYELLYRDSASNAFTAGLDGSMASRKLISQAITVFGLDKLTNTKRAFINFTREVLFSDLVYSLSPKDIVIEVLEDITVDPQLVERIKKLQGDGYTLALDDYTGSADYEPLLTLVDIIKVDFRLTNADEQKEIARALKKHRNLRLLAEKVEDAAEFERARDCGYSLFQGYYFAKPVVTASTHIEASKQACYRLLSEFNRPEYDIGRIAGIIKTDVDLSYKLLKMVNSSRYYRGNRITTVQSAITLLGIKRIQGWVMLIMLSGMNDDQPQELSKTALVRGFFAQKLANALELDGDEAFTLGLFSLIDVMLERDMEDILPELPLTPGIILALQHENEPMSAFIDAAVAFERADWRNIEACAARLELPAGGMSDMYVESLANADNIFGGII